MATHLDDTELRTGPSTAFPHGLIRNAWYVAAYSREVGRTLLARTILGKPIVLYRTEAGRPVAFHDACPHRAMPLSMGALRGDNLRCMYHGAMFDPEGTGIEVPSQHQVPPGFCVRRYPLIEAGYWIWIWMGDPAAADPALLPDQSILGHGAEGFHTLPTKYRHVEARYHLLNENLVDDTHITFVHRGQFDSGGRVHTPPQVGERDGIIVTRWYDPKERIAVPMRLLLDLDHEVGPRGLLGHFRPPATHGIWIQAWDPNEPDKLIRTCIIAFCFTPETETTTHLFIGHARNYRKGDADWDFHVAHSFDATQSQDGTVVEAIEQVMRKNQIVQEEVSFRSDTSIMRARRIMNEMLRRESNQPR
jgi:vanillate O-demethylase monooxygenase subunit